MPAAFYHNFVLHPLQINGASNLVYRVDSSQDLINWQILTNVTGGGLTTTDYNANSSPYKFYRACASPVGYGPVSNGLVCWYKPDQIMTDSVFTNRVRFWFNSVGSFVFGSTNGFQLNLGSPNDQQMPYYLASGLAGYPGALFTNFVDVPPSGYVDGDRLFATNSSNLTSDNYTIFVVLRNWSGGAYGGGPIMRLWDPTTVSAQEVRIGESGSPNLYSPVGSLTVTQAVPQKGALIEAQFFPTSFSICLNGTNNGVQTNLNGMSISNILRGLDIGYRTNNTGNAFLNGEVYEVLVYTNILNNQQGNQTGKYLADKYGLTTAYSYQIPAEPVQLADISGPPHGTWGTSISCSITLNSSGLQSAMPNTATLGLRLRGTQSAGTPVASLEFGNLSPGGAISKGLNFTLPPTPDPAGNLDGDYELIVSLASPGQSNIVLQPPLPIHIETRDPNGLIDCVYVPRICDFVGATPGGNPGWPIDPTWLDETGIRNGRASCYWDMFEPQQDVWNADAFCNFGHLLLQAKQYDMTVIPMIGDVPFWAQSNPNCVVDCPPSPSPAGTWGLPASTVAWQAFVQQAVGFFSRPPYLQQNWQVWNEADGCGFLCPESAFPDPFLTTIYDPAARIIRSNYSDLNLDGIKDAGEQCRVVYGGFTHLGSGSDDYAATLQTDNSGQLTDILDAHYVEQTNDDGLNWFSDPSGSRDVYDAWIATGQAFGCWTSEMGACDAFDPSFTPLFYLRSLTWALNHSWTNKLEYRSYFFNYYSATNGDSRCRSGESYGIVGNGPITTGGIRQWPNGYSIQTLTQVMNGDIALPDPSRLILQSDSASSANYSNINYIGNPYQPLVAGGRLVIPFQPPPNATPKTINSSSFAISLKSGETVQSVTRITYVRGSSNSLPFSVLDGLLQFANYYNISMAKDDDGMESAYTTNCYLVVQCTDSLFEERYRPEYIGMVDWFNPDGIGVDSTYANRVAVWTNSAPMTSGNSSLNLGKPDDWEMPFYVSSGLGGYPAAQFDFNTNNGPDGYRLFSSNSIPLTSDTYTVFMVVQNWSGGLANGGPLLRLWDSSTGGLGYGGLIMGYSGVLDLYSDAGETISTNIPPSGGAIIESTFFRQGFASYINGVSIISQVTLNGTNVPRVSRGVDLGHERSTFDSGLSSLLGQFTDAQVSEILIYTNTLSTSQRKQTGQYLASKYGLPSGY